MYGAFTLSGRLSQNLSIKLAESIPRSEPQDARILVWPLPVSLAATSGITCCFLFLRLLRCFSSPGSLRMAMDLPYDDWGVLSQVSPFRDLRIKGYLPLPEAYRSLSRLSSALSAKASTLRSFQLNQFFRSYSVMSVGSLGFCSFSWTVYLLLRWHKAFDTFFSRMSCIFCVKDIVSFSVCNFQGTCVIRICLKFLSKNRFSFIGEINFSSF